METPQRFPHLLRRDFLKASILAEATILGGDSLQALDRKPMVASWPAKGKRGAVAGGGANAVNPAATMLLAMCVTDSSLFCFGGEVPILYHDGGPLERWRSSLAWAPPRNWPPSSISPKASPGSLRPMVTGPWRAHPCGRSRRPSPPHRRTSHRKLLRLPDLQMWPVNSGPCLLQALGFIEGFDLQELGRNSPSTIHLAVEALKLALADPNTFYADPQCESVPTEALLARQYTELRRALIDLAACRSSRMDGMKEAPRRFSAVAGTHPAFRGAGWVFKRLGRRSGGGACRRRSIRSIRWPLRLGRADESRESREPL